MYRLHSPDNVLWMNLLQALSITLELPAEQKSDMEDNEQAVFLKRKTGCLIHSGNNHTKRKERATQFQKGWKKQQGLQSKENPRTARWSIFLLLNSLQINKRIKKKKRIAIHIFCRKAMLPLQH